MQYRHFRVLALEPAPTDLVVREGVLPGFTSNFCALPSSPLACRANLMECQAMPEKLKSHTYTARIERMGNGLRHHVVPVPDETAASLITAGHKRVLLTMRGRTYRRALQNRRELGYLIIVGRPILRETGLRYGSPVEVVLRSDPEPDAIETPEELRAVLAQDEEARARWESFTPGKKRSYIVYLSTAKRSETRLKRSLELAEKMRTHTLHSDQTK